MTFPLELPASRGLAAWAGGLLLAAALGAAEPAAPARRTLTLVVPAVAAAGNAVEVVTTATTGAGAGERIGFLHGEYSLDGGRTWTAFCYEADLGTEATRRTSIVAGPAGSTVQVRVRAAFRGGVAGDVDHTGAAIRWQDSWAVWSQPPARGAVIAIGAAP